MKRLSDLDELECHAGDQLHPALDRAKEPGSRIREIFAEACPGSLTPPVDVWLISIGNQRMQRLNHQRSAWVDQRRRPPHDSLDGFLPDQRKVGYRDIYPNFQLARRDFLVRRDAKLS